MLRFEFARIIGLGGSPVIIAQKLGNLVAAMRNDTALVGRNHVPDKVLDLLHVSSADDISEPDLLTSDQRY